jgi:hypothetical protein
MAWKWGLQNELVESHPYYNEPTKLNKGLMPLPRAKLVKEKLSLIEGLRFLFDASSITISGPISEISEHSIVREICISLKTKCNDPSESAQVTLLIDSLNRFA